MARFTDEELRAMSVEELAALGMQGEEEFDRACCEACRK